MMEQVTGFSLAKNRSVQASDWSKRPLSSAQIHYAASDAKICSILWETITLEGSLRDAILTSMAEPLVMPSAASLQRYRRTITNQTCSMSELLSHAIELANPAPILSVPPAGPVKPSYTAVFLAENQQKKLLEVYPAQHRNVLADHVTLAYAPNTASLAGLPIGSQCRIHVSEILHDHKSQVARVSLLDDNDELTGFVNFPQTMHITISTAANVPASRSSELLQLANEKSPDIDKIEGESTTIIKVVADMILEGTVGLLVHLTEDQDLLASLNKSVLGKLTKFSESKTPGSMLRFRGGTLNPTERAAIHAFCEANDIVSRSEGPKDNRKLTLSFPKFLRKSEEGIAEVTNTGRIIKSAVDIDDNTKQKKSSKFRSRDARNIPISYICLSLDIFMLIEWHNHERDPSFISPIGKLCFVRSTEMNVPEIHIDPERQRQNDPGSDEALLMSLIVSGKLPTEVPKPVVVIMRGLPGSGKSSWAQCLKEHCGSEQSTTIVSADNFFEKTGQYERHFEQSRLAEAHEFCRVNFVRELGNKKKSAVIVDNTNSRLAEYKFYIDMARKAGKRHLVVEILCQSENDLQEFYHRNTHRVPMQTIGRMRARWENDPNSLPFISVTHSNAGNVRSPVALPAKESLRAWLTQNHMFHNTKTRGKTYLNMATDMTESKFITVPRDLETEFLRRYAQDEGAWCLAEYATLPLFPFFCDIDQVYFTQSEAIDMIYVASSLSAVLNSWKKGSQRSSIIVVGRLEEQDKCGVYKLGCHLHCPSAVVSQDEALKLRALFIKELAGDRNCNKDWNEIVDSSVYEHMTMRLLGSNKPGPTRRVYDLIGVIGVDGRPDYSKESQYRQDRVQLLSDCSIRLKDDHFDSKV